MTQPEKPETFFVRKFVINQILVVLCLLEEQSPSEGVIQRRIKVLKLPLPSWVRPKRVTKRDVKDMPSRKQFDIKISK